MKTLCLTLMTVTALAATTSAMAALSGEDKQEVEQMLSGVLYTRVDVPCETRGQAAGSSKRPLVEVGPNGISSEARSPVGEEAEAFPARGASSALEPNDPVTAATIDFDEEKIVIALDGTGSASGRESVIKFVRIRSIDDFLAAFAQAFSRVPLQQEHPEWPRDVRRAIAERRLVPGMTKQQAYYVTGAPLAVKHFEQSGKQIETWSLRRYDASNAESGTIRAGQRTGLPAAVRFENGRLVRIGRAPAEAGMNMGD